VLGRSIRKLADGNQNAGEHKVIWDGKDGNGATLASGIYLIRWSTPDQMQLKKVVFMR
jgi:flagellar hook assembly protein FlgD